MPVSDPVDKVRCGGSHAQLEVVAAYRDAVRKLERAHTQNTKDDHAGGGGKKNKGDGKGATRRAPAMASDAACSCFRKAGGWIRLTQPLQNLFGDKQKLRQAT